MHKPVPSIASTPAITNNHWVAAAPFRAHLRYLCDTTGLPWQVLAVHAELSISLANHLLNGRNGHQLRRISRDCAIRLLSVTPTSAASLAHDWVSTGRAEQVVKNLLARGWSPSAVAAAAGVELSMVSALARRPPTHLPSLADASLRALLATVDVAAA